MEAEHERGAEDDQRSPASGRRLKVPGWARLLAVFFLGALIAPFSLALAPSPAYPVGPAHLTARATIGEGSTTVRFPPLGSASAVTHRTPLALQVSLVELDLASLAKVVGDASPLALRREVEADLRSVGRIFALRSLATATFAGALLLALLPRRRVRYVLMGAVGGAVGAGILLAATAATFEAERFAEPRFTGALTQAPVVIDAISEGRVALGDVRSRYEGAAERLSNLMAVMAVPDQDPAIGSVAILHISDVHSNPAGIEIARQLARRFEVDAVLDTGDLINFGIELEARMADLVSRFDVPYLFVRGNHDSDAVVSRLAQTDGVTVIGDGEVVEVGDLRILGWGDPTYTNWDALSPADAAQVRRATAERVAAGVEEERPDVLAVHDHRLAERSLGSVPLVLSGHYHRKLVEEHLGTRVRGVGTTGASGFKSFTLEAEMDHEAQVLYFRNGVVVALDYVTFSGLGGDFQIERSILPATPLSGPDPDVGLDETDDPDQ